MFRSRWHRLKMAHRRLVIRSSGAIFALYISFCGGLAAVFIDLDHATLFFGHKDGRVAHAPLLVLACLVGGYCLARIGRLVYRMVLRKQK